jgi:hypothetical protein
MKMMDKFIGQRKFVVTLIALIGNQLLVWFDKIDAGVYSVVAVAVISAYIVGNIYQKFNQK